MTLSEIPLNEIVFGAGVVVCIALGLIAGLLS